MTVFQRGRLHFPWCLKKCIFYLVPHSYVVPQNLHRSVSFIKGEIHRKSRNVTCSPERKWLCWHVASYAWETVIFWKTQFSVWVTCNIIYVIQRNILDESFLFLKHRFYKYYCKRSEHVTADCGQNRFKIHHQFVSENEKFAQIKYFNSANTI